MATNKITTRIVMRNDELSAWEKSTLSLLQGELALAQNENGDFEIRVGTGDKTWNGLSSQGHLVINKHNEITSTNELSALSATATDGDTCVVKELIANGKYSYTGYVWNGTAWAAMDGNYDASNVFFSDNLTYTTAIGAIAAPAGGSDTLNTAGTSVEDLFKQILAKEVAGTISRNPSTSAPTLYAKINGTGSEVAAATTKTVSYEYGTYLTGVRFSGATFTKGTYKYGPDTTQTTCTWTTTGTGLAITDGANSNSGTCENVVIGDKDKDTDNATLSAYTTATSFSVTTRGYTVADTVEAYTNMGVPNTDKGFAIVQFGANYNMGNKTSGTFSGYRNMFYGSSTNIVTLNSANIRALAGKSATKSSGTITVTVVDGSKHVIIAVPSNRSITKVIDVGAFGTDIFGKFTQTATVDVEGANGYTPISYKIYEYKPDAALGANTYTVSLA